MPPSGKNSRGGARNHRHRLSYVITAAATHDLLRAVNFACEQGVHLNRFITISWFKAGISDTEAMQCLTRFLKAAGDWLRSKGGYFAWVYVRECDPGSAIGSHVHILAHVPPKLATPFGRRTRGWLTRATGQRYVRRMIKSRAVGRNSRSCVANPPLYEVNLHKTVSYMLKAAEPSVRAALGLRGAHKPGPVIGKRTGTSQNLGRAARGQSKASV